MAVSLVLAYAIGYANGKPKTIPQDTTCVDDQYQIINRTDCSLSGKNIVSGQMDGETLMFKNFTDIGVCGLYSCKGDAQGTYECFERSKLRKRE